jgi:phosphonate degradation associated HDIG domain protein
MKVIEELQLFFQTKGNEVYGEDVTITQHSVQSGQLAEKAGFDEDVVVAAFLHDIGHFFDNNENMTVSKEDGNSEVLGTLSHEKIGAEYLRKNGFSEKIAALVEGHVQAKRYLTFKNPEYYHELSEASKQTLVFQGGKMNADEAVAFEQNPYFELSIQMRKWDEEAKEANIPVKDELKYFMDLVKKQITSIEK